MRTPFLRDPRVCPTGSLADQWGLTKEGLFVVIEARQRREHIVEKTQLWQTGHASWHLKEDVTKEWFQEPPQQTGTRHDVDPRF